MWTPQGFYSQYALHTPVILSGEKAVQDLYNFPASRIFVIHGKSFFDKELFLETFSKRCIRFVERSWTSEPDLESLRETIHQMEEYHPDVIIAVGGGSVIDGSKLCRLFYEFPFYNEGNSKIDGEVLKTHFIAIPTTMGSGAEVSSSAVYYDKGNHKKGFIVLHELQPDVVVYDKRYVENTPERLFYTSSLDALAHIIEGYISNKENSLIDVIAEEGLLLLCTELRKMVNREKETIDYQRLQYAGFLGGLVQNHCIVGAAHAIAHQLTIYEYSHSEAIALLLPAVICLNSTDEVTYKRLQKIATCAGFYDISEMILFINEIRKLSGIIYRQEDLRETLSTLSHDEAFRENVKNDMGGKGNPIAITDEYIEKLIRGI